MWDALGDKITCYRGCAEGNRRGIFYSLDRSVAEVHARLWKGSVHSYIFNKADCIFFGGQGKEVIYVPALLLSTHLK